MPAILLACGLAFLFTPWSGRIQWKAEGEGRYLTRQDILGFDIRDFGYAEGYMYHGVPQWDMFITAGFPVRLLCFGLAAWIVVRDLRSPARNAETEPPTCLECGYDLRASPVRCPECGAIPKNISN